MIRVGIIGVGAICRRAYLPGFSRPDSENAAKAMKGYRYNGCEDVELVALVDIDLKKAEELADEFDVKEVYQDWTKLVDKKDLDLICIATPNYLHAEMSIAALKRGKHVLVEKPMAISRKEMDTMIRVAKEAKRLLMVDQTLKFDPVYETAKQIIETGVIGKIFSLRASHSCGGPGPWSPTGKWFFEKEKAVYGALFDEGIHKIDAIRYITGKEVAEVSAFLSNLQPDIEVEDNAVCMLKFEDGSLGVLQASWTTNPDDHSLCIYGEKGTLKVGMEPERKILVEFSTPSSVYMKTDIPEGDISNALYLPQIPAYSKYGGPFRHCIDCIKTGKTPIILGEEAKKSTEILLSAYESWSKRRVVEVS